MGRIKKYHGFNGVKLKMEAHLILKHQKRLITTGD
jgi:hypothetical protein